MEPIGRSQIYRPFPGIVESALQTTIVLSLARSLIENLINHRPSVIANTGLVLSGLQNVGSCVKLKFLHFKIPHNQFPVCQLLGPATVHCRLRHITNHHYQHHQPDAPTMCDEALSSLRNCDRFAKGSFLLGICEASSMFYLFASCWNRRLRDITNHHH